MHIRIGVTFLFGSEIIVLSANGFVNGQSALPPEHQKQAGHTQYHPSQLTQGDSFLI